MASLKSCDTESFVVKSFGRYCVKFRFVSLSESKLVLILSA